MNSSKRSDLLFGNRCLGRNDSGLTNLPSMSTLFYGYRPSGEVGASVGTPCVAAEGGGVTNDVSAPSKKPLVGMPMKADNSSAVG